MSKAYVAAVAAATVLAVGGVTACGASDDSGKDGGRSGVSDGGGRKSGAGAADSGDSVDSAESELAEAMRNLSRVVSATGPVICWNQNAEGGWRAAAFDAGLGKRVATFSEKPLLPRLAEIARSVGGVDARVGNLCGEGQYGDHPGEAGVSPVSPDGRRVAVEVDTDDRDSEWHVGWLDLVTGKFTDITKASEKKGYSPEKHSDQTPGFAPDGSLWFLRDSQEYVSADKSGRLSQHPISEACAGERRRDTVFYRPVKSAAVTCPRVIHPSGKFAASPTTVAVGLYTVDGFDLSVLGPRIDRLSDDPDVGALTNQVVVRDDGDLRGCVPMSWISAADLLCQGSSNDFFIIRVDVSKARDDLDAMHTVEVGVRREVAPATENKIFSVAVAKDRRSIYIASSQSGEDADVKLYRASLTTPGEPEELGPLPQGVGDDFVLRGNFQTGDFQ
ncbi:hypothetical protein SAZ11_40690 [Streptomyces sp. FXJ1.4098]|uniref:hypothetical protein n=1 Tax=Streptomyces sp. NPDC020845 TaxID=3365096 RepID=UPI00299BFCCD|nr:hypothetical protein [Streptomyces sp. FXJ1.4098]